MPPSRTSTATPSLTVATTRFDGLRRALALRETPYAICTGIGGWCAICWYMRGLERWFMDLVEPGVLRCPLGRTLQYWLDFYRLSRAVGDLIDVVMIGDL